MVSLRLFLRLAWFWFARVFCSAVLFSHALVVRLGVVSLVFALRMVCFRLRVLFVSFVFIVFISSVFTVVVFLFGGSCLVGCLLVGFVSIVVRSSV